MGHGASHQRIVEGRAGAVEQDVHEGADAAEQAKALVGLDRRHAGPGHVFDHVHVARLQGGEAQVLIRIDRHADGLHARQGGQPVVGRGLQLDPAAALLRGDAVGAAADGVVRVARAVPDDRHVIVGEPQRHGRDRRLHHQAHSVRVGRLDTLDLLHLRAVVGGGAVAGDLLDGPLHVARGDRLAIVVLRPRVQAEHPGAGIVAAPFAGEFALQFPALVEAHQASMRQGLDHACGGTGGGPGPQVRRPHRQAVAQHVGTLLCGRRPGQGDGAEPGNAERDTAGERWQIHHGPRSICCADATRFTGGCQALTSAARVSRSAQMIGLPAGSFLHHAARMVRMSGLRRQALDQPSFALRVRGFRAAGLPASRIASWVPWFGND